MPYPAFARWGMLRGIMNRDVIKFGSAVAATMSYVHVAYAIAAAKGIVSIPVFLGRKWGVGKMWTEAVVYAAIGIGLGYLGWRSTPAKLDAATREQERMT